jgi:hypothetical protein
MRFDRDQTNKVVVLQMPIGTHVSEVSLASGRIVRPDERGRIFVDGPSSLPLINSGWVPIPTPRGV